MRGLLLLVLLLTTPAPPRARWDGPHAATIEWTQHTRGCLSQLPSPFIGCYDGAGMVRTTLGQHGPLSGDLRPMGGTVYRVVVDGAVWDVPLRSVVYLATIRR